MAGKVIQYQFNSDSNMLLKKCAGECHGTVDRISGLPDEIIILILSFLSLREAISTSVLSSRWPDLWKHIPELHFNFDLIAIKPRVPREFGSREMEKFMCIEMVDCVLLSHKSLLIKDLKIDLHLSKSMRFAVSNWLEMLISRQVERLEWDFRSNYDMDKVVLADILRDNKVRLSQADVIFFKSLQRLSLRGLEVSGEDIELFLRNCPRLEYLSIQYSVLTSDVVVCGTTLVLKHLDIYSCSGKISIKVSAPKLIRLRFYTREENKLLLENLPNLIWADFTYRSQTKDYAKHFASAVFCCISRLKYLKLALLYPKGFLVNGFPQMPNLKRLEITYHGVHELGLLPLTALIWASPHLEEFNLEYIKVARDPIPWLQGLKNLRRRPHRHLKAFRFKGFLVDAADHIALVTYISNNCVALKKIIISFPFQSWTDSQRTAKAEADRDRTKQLLQGKVPHHIQLLLLV